MNVPAVVCKQERRRQSVRAQPNLNGLDYLEVEDEGQTLRVHLLGKLPEAWQDMDGDTLRRHFRLDGGQRIRDVAILTVSPNSAAAVDEDDWLDIGLNKPGDFST